jgi:hypothetical protein
MTRPRAGQYPVIRQPSPYGLVAMPLPLWFSAPWFSASGTITERA